jgi:hypothetical protein
MRYLVALLLLLLVAAAAALAWIWPRYDYVAAQTSPWTVERLPRNPILSAVAEERGYININGPSVILVPDWVERPLGRYYMYFAHHKGSYIRLAVADDPTGPWTVYDPGVLRLEDTGLPVQLVEEPAGSEALSELFSTFSPQVARDYLILLYRATVSDPALRRERGMSAAANQMPHIASPEVIVDHERRQLVMYFHGYDARGSQSSRIATSTDGMNFEMQPGRLLSTYLRSFEYDGQQYLLGMPGVIYRADSPLGPFHPRDRLLFEPDMRHAGLHVEGDTLYVFWSKVGYAPERIMLSVVDLRPDDWNLWQASHPVDLMRPAQEWEGGSLPVTQSLRGELDEPANELRDPFVFRDEDDQLYLFYVGGGEQAIGVARLLEAAAPTTP